MGTRIAPSFDNNLLDSILYAMVTHAQQNPVPFIIVLKMLACTWRERNVVCYCDDRAHIPIGQLLLNAETHGRALMDCNESGRKHRKWEEELCFLHEAAKPPKYYKRSHKL